MKTKYGLLCFLLLLMGSTYGQFNNEVVGYNQYHDKPKYAIAGAGVGAFTYAVSRYYLNAFHITNNHKKALLISNGSVLALALIKQGFDYAKWGNKGDDYLNDVGTALLSSLSITYSIRLFDKPKNRVHYQY